MSRFQMVYAGFWRAERTTTLYRDGKAEVVRVIVDVRHVPEWVGRDKWSVEIETIGREWSTRLVECGDVPVRSKAEGIASAEAMLAAGWAWHPGLGYCGR